MTRPTPAAASAKAVASLSRSDPPGRAKNQRRQVATAKAGTLTEVNCSTTSWAGSSPRSNPFRKWKSDQSRAAIVGSGLGVLAQEAPAGPLVVAEEPNDGTGACSLLTQQIPPSPIMRPCA